MSGAIPAISERNSEPVSNAVPPIPGALRAREAFRIFSSSASSFFLSAFSFASRMIFSSSSRCSFSCCRIAFSCSAVKPPFGEEDDAEDDSAGEDSASLEDSPALSPVRSPIFTPVIPDASEWPADPSLLTPALPVSPSPAVSDDAGSSPPRASGFSADAAESARPAESSDGTDDGDISLLPDGF